MKRPDRGAKSCVEGVASSTSVPRGRKDRGQGRSSRDRTRAIHIRCLWAGAFSASHEREAPDSFPFAKCASLACTLSYTDLQISLPCLQSHIPPDPRLSVFPSVADKNVIPISFQNSLQNPSPSDPLQIQIYFLQRVCPPNPHLLLLDGPFPSSNFMRSVFPANCPDSRGQ